MTLRVRHALVATAAVAALAAAVGAAVIASASAAAPAGAGARAARTPPTAVGVREKEWNIAVYRKVVRARRIKLNVFNRGQDRHDLRITGNGVERTTAQIRPGQNASLTLTVSPGTYRLVCTLKRHQARGMHTSLTVLRPKRRRR